MGIVAFWAAVVAVWLFFRLTTKDQRRELLSTGWLVLFVTGAIGLSWALALGTAHARIGRPG